MFDALERWLRLSAERLHDQAAALTALDQAIGDGDHGINMDRGFTAIVASLDAGVAEAETICCGPAAMLRTAGRTLISTVGGAVGTAVRHGVHARRRARSPRRTRSRRPAEVVLAALEAAIGGIQSLGKATTGEKTMLDALVPALDAGRKAVAGGAGVGRRHAPRWPTPPRPASRPRCPMLATKGRASYLGERSVGHQDPGATSSALLLLRTLADVVAAAADGPDRGRCS